MPVYTDVYTVDGSKILSEQRTDEETGNVIRTIYYVCDANGQPVGMKYNGVQYWYRKNMQGDVVRILNASGAEVVSYAYDAWGKVLSVSGSLSSTVGAANPFRYRGYYYDTETGWYYLNTRYYDPNVGRFLSPDNVNLLLASPRALTDKNLYAYCDNNPVMRIDRGGEFWDTIFDVVSLVVSVVDVVKNPTDPMAWAGLAADAVCLVTPGLTGGGTIVKATSKADDIIDVVQTTKKVDKVSEVVKHTDKIHGNSLKSTKETIGYALRKRDSGEIMKYGETTRGTKRYTQKFYRENDVYMEPMAKGTKYEMHYWQHERIQTFFNEYGHLPPMNKSFW